MKATLLDTVLSDTQLCSSCRIGPSRFRTRGLSTIREPTSRGVRSRPSSTSFCAKVVQLVSCYTEIYGAPVSCGGRKLLLRSYQAQARRLGPCTHFFHVVVKRQCSSCSLLRPTRILTSPSARRSYFLQHGTQRHTFLLLCLPPCKVWGVSARD